MNTHQFARLPRGWANSCATFPKIPLRYLPTEEVRLPSTRVQDPRTQVRINRMSR